MIKACIRTLLVMLLALLQPASAQQSMDDIFARMDRSDEIRAKEGPSTSFGDEKDAERIDSLFKEGVALYQQGEYPEALAVFNAVLAIDQYNSGALTYKKHTMERVGAKAAGQMLSTRAEALAVVDGEWNEEPSAAGTVDDAEIMAASTASGNQATERMISRLKAIRIPVFDMAEATIEEVVQFFAEASRGEDGSGEDVDILLVGMESADADNNITISVDDINLYEALQYVVEMASLKFEIKQNLVIIMPANYVPASKMVLESYDIIPEVGDDLISTSNDSGSTTDLFDTSSEVSSSGPIDVSGFFTLVDFPEGSSAVYQERFQKLFVKNTPRNLKAVEAVLDDLTEKAVQGRSEQVEIEAKFVEFNEGAIAELGFDWTVYGSGSVLGMEMDDEGSYYKNLTRYATRQPTQPQGQGPSVLFYSDPVTGAQRLPSASVAQNFFGAHQRNNTTAYGTVDSGILQTLGGVPAEMVFENGDVELRISAMEQEGTADVLSAPRVTTKSGYQAIIRVAETHRYPRDWEAETGQSTAPIIRPQDWDDVDLGISLTVTPVVDAENGTIELDLSPEILLFRGFDLYKTGVSLHDSGGNDVSGIIGGGQPLFAQMAAFERRNVQTQVIVADGSTFMMGGLVSERNETFRDQVPFVGSIPYLGRLFRTEGSRTEKVNLMIFVKASMVDTRGMTRAERELARR